MKQLCSLAAVAALVALCVAQKCPEDLGPHGVTFIPHPTDCSSYYRCTKSGPKLEICPSYHNTGPLCFNDVEKICDWSANVRCCSPFLPTSSSTSTTTTTTTTAPKPDPSKCPNVGKTPVANCLKYSSDNEEFCCAQNWAFNPKLCLCDLKRNVPSCQPTDAELAECNQYNANSLSPLGRFVSLIHGDVHPVASNDDMFSAPPTE